MDRARAQAAQAAGVPASALFEVRVLALNAYFLGHQSARCLMLTPVLDDAALGLKAGEPRLASDVFALPRPLTLRRDGQPT